MILRERFDFVGTTFDGQGNLIIMDDDALLFIPVKNVKKAIDLFKEDK